jgi:hypothetical protein
MRTTSSASGSAAICTCATTAPFFCAKPVKSNVLTWRPSRCAAIARMAPAVTMPPPPMPANRPRHTSGEGHHRLARRAPVRFSGPATAGRRPARGRPGNVTKLGQKPFRQDRSTLQACRVDAALAAKRGFHRFDRDTTGLRRAIAAVLAHCFVDHHVLRRLRHRAALAAAAFFGGADLIVDQHGRAVVIAQRCAAPRPGRREYAWSRQEGSADFGGSRSASSATMAMRLTPSAATWAASIGTVVAALGRLAAGHRDRVVEQQLVGHARSGDRPGGSPGCRNVDRCHHRYWRTCASYR